MSSCNRSSRCDSPDTAAKSRSGKAGEMAGAQSFSGLVVRFIRHNILTLLNIAGVIGGVVVAVVLRASRDEPWTAREVMYVGFVGQLSRHQSLTHSFIHSFVRYGIPGLFH